MSITQPDDRVTSYNPVVPTMTFAADFPVFDNSDLVVIHNGVQRADFTVQATYVASISNDARVVFATGITGSVLVVGSRESRRSNRFGAGPINANMLNAAFDTVQGEMQEGRRDIDRALKAEFGQSGLVLDAEIPDNSSLMKVGTRVKAGPDVVALANQAVSSSTAIAVNAASRSEAARDVAVEAAADTVAQGFVPIFDSRSGAASFDLSHFNTITAKRWAPFSMVAPASYLKVSAEPAHDMKFQDAQGNWFELDEPNPDIRMAGAIANGISDITPAINRLRAYIKAKVVPTYGGNSGTILVPNGNFICSGIDLEPGEKIKGFGSRSSIISLLSGQNRSLIRILALPAAPSVDSYVSATNYASIEGISLNANRGAQTSGTSWAIEVVDSPLTIGARYDNSVRLKDVTGDFGRSGGIYIGANRNWPMLDSCRFWYSGGPAIKMKDNYDGRFTDCDFGGASTDVGTFSPIEIDGGGQIDFVGCNAYGAVNGQPVVKLSAAVSNRVSFVGGNIGDAGYNIFEARGGPLIVMGSNLGGPWRAGGSPGAFVRAYNLPDDFISLIGCRFTAPAGQATYLVEHIGGAKRVAIVSPMYDRLSPPFVTMTNGKLSDSPKSEFSISQPTRGNAAMAYAQSHLSGTMFSASGLGFNLWRDEVTGLWNYGGDGSKNGGMLIDCTIDGEFRIFARPSSGGSAGTLTDTQLLALFVLKISPGGNVQMPNLRSTNPGAGTKQLWYDPADSNRVKFAP